MLPADRNCFNYQLTKSQHNLLKRLANGRVKIYCMPAGVRRDKRCEEINEEFNGVLQLVELGVLNDVSEGEKFAHIVEQHRASENRDVVIVWLNGYGEALFQKVPHERWVC